MTRPPNEPAGGIPEVPENLADGTFEENRRLRGTLRDLVALSALPAAWIGLGVEGIARSLADVLKDTLSLDLVYVRLGPAGEGQVEVFRSEAGADAAQVEAAKTSLAPLLRTDSPAPHAAIPDPFGAGTLRVAVTRFGIGEDQGVLVTGSHKAEFPTERDRLLLGVGANQTAIVVQRQRAEAQLHERQEWLRVTLASIGDAVIATDTAGRVTFLNSAAEQLTGWTPREARGQLLDAVFPILDEQTRQPAESPVEKVLRDGGTVGLGNDTVLLAKDGTQRPIDDSAAPIRDASGKMIGVVLIFRDVTEQRQAQSRVRQSEARFRSLMEQAPFSIQLFAPDGTTLQVNRAWEALWGVKFEEIGTYNILEDQQLEASGALDYIRPAFAGHAATIPAVQYDPNETIPGIAPHGDPRRWLSAVIYPLKDPDGRVREVVLIHEDITAKRLAEEALRESEEKFRLLADTIPQLAWMARPDGHIFWFNRRWYEYTGTTPEQMEGWLWQSVHDPETLPQVLERWKHSIASGGPLDMVFPLKGADGRFRPFLTRVNPLRDQAGRILYWFGTNTDISDIKRMEDALRENDRRKDEFLATLAHELRNPLAPLRNSLQILKMPRVDATTAQQTRDMMERQVHHLVRLVDDLLDVSRVMRGKIQLRTEQVELASVVARAVETVQPLVELQGNELDLSIPPDSLLLEADPIRLSQVIGNLLTNAAKYTEPGGHIWLSAWREADEAVLRVRDDGIGIAPDLLPHIFELFVQVDHESEHPQGGLGIGLTLVRNLVEMHGGTIHARSAGLGHGAEFVVHLPLAVQQRQAPNESDPADRRHEAALSGHRLLVVDDNRDAALSLATLLRMNGHDARVAGDGTSALELARTFQPVLIFLDLGMPGMDGYEVARRIRRTVGLENTMLAALTGWGQSEDRRRTADAGFDHHLVKPVEPQALERLLATLKWHHDGRGAVRPDRE